MYLKHLIPVLLIILPYFLKGQCPLSLLLIDSQEDVADFVDTHPDCNTLPGSVQILGEDITQIDLLNQIVAIEGSLLINNTSLTSLSGLGNLASVGGDVIIINNDNLKDTGALNNLSRVGDDIEIRFNESLESIGAFNRLNVISGNLFITQNKALKKLNAFNELIRIEEFFTLSNNEELNEMNGLAMLRSIGGSFTVFNNNSIKSMRGLESLSLVQRDVLVADNDSLLNFIGLSDSSLDDLKVDGNFGVLNNPKLESLEGLERLRTLAGNFVLDNNAILQDLSGTAGLDSIGQTLVIASNPQLTTLAGLSNLVYIGRELSIVFNDQLESLAGVSGPVQIGDTLFTNDRIQIVGNNSLLDLSIIASIELKAYETFSSINISDNGSLSTCEIELVCNLVENSTERITIQNNAVGCQNEDQVKERCAVSNNEDVVSSHISIFPNPAVDEIHFNGQNISGSIDVFDLSGKYIRSYSCSSCSGINLLGLEGGMYFLLFEEFPGFIYKFVKI